MKKIFLFIILGFYLSSCATNIEPNAEKNNPAKIDDKIKIAYSSPSEIIIMFKLNPLSFNFAGYIKPSDKFVQTAFNHCSIYKKNTYYFYFHVSNKYTQYDWRSYSYNNKIYQGNRFICAADVNEAMRYTSSSNIAFYGDRDKFLFDYGTNVFEKKRILSEQEIAENKQKEIEKEKRLAEAKKQIRKMQEKEFEPEFGKLCLKNENNNKFLKGSDKYIDCLIEENNKSEAKKIEEQEEKKRKLAELQKKLAAMSPTERHAYNCSETFNFKKGTEKFNDCVFELYTAELEIQKLELEKKVAEANAKAATNEQLRAEALVKAQIAAANATTRAANLNRSMQLMKLSEQLIKGNQQQNPLNKTVRMQTSCSTVGGFFTCQ